MLRRLDRCLRVTQVESLSTYLGYLRGQPHEAEVLLKDLLISVTTFFRDPDAFEALRVQVIPQLFEEKGLSDEVRVWVPGCATGEEAYAIAMLLLEQTDTREMRSPLQIFASDLDEDALVFGREGLYPEAIAADVSETRLQRFFIREGAYYRVKQELRDLILFAPHSLLKDPPFSRLDLISCRNLLIYLRRDLQEKVAELFHYALKPEGYLFLGGAESLDNLSSLFHTLDKTHRLYRREPSLTYGLAHLPELPLSGNVSGRLTLFRHRPVSPPSAASDGELHRLTLETYAPPSLLVDADANIIHVSETANCYLQFPSGSPSPNLYRAALPELRLELRTALYRALDRHEATFTTPVPVEIRGQRRLVQLYVTPAQPEQTPPLALVVLIEANPPDPQIPPAAVSAAGGVDLRSRQMEEEFEATKAQLRSTIESAETQHEELKAANEELQSVNEEYKSTLEELETSKEELQSINEELKTVNQELQERLKEISQANNDFQNLMAATEVATLFVDRQLRIKLYTLPLAQLFNVRPLDQGRPLAHVTHRFSDAQILGNIQQVLTTLVPIEREVQRDDGHYYLMRLTPYRTTEDHISGVVITFVDISARKQAELALQRAHDELEERVKARTTELAETLEALRHEVAEREQVEEELLRARKLDSVGVLAGGIAHDFNNLLTGVLGNISLAKLLVGADAKVVARLTEAEKACQRATALTQQLLTFATGGAPVRQTVSLAHLLTESVTFALRGAKVRGDFRIADDLWPVDADSGQMSQVFHNVVLNAVQAMPGGGTIEVRADNVALGASASPPLPEGRYINIAMQDHGCGMPPDVLPKIFDPYFTTNAAGSGLGLTTAYAIVVKHDGYITVASEVGVGTTVVIYLPASQQTVTPAPTRSDVPLVGHGRILVMDDEDMICDLLHELLPSLGYEVECVHDGRAAIAAYQRAQAARQPFAAVILDSTIPDGMGGRETIAHLRTLNPQVVALLSSGYTNDPMMTNYAQDGFRGVVPKPYTVEKLQETLQRVLQEGHGTP